MRSIAAILILFLLPPVSWAWGPTGHRAVALVAENHLSPEAAAAVHELLGSETLPMVAAWADAVRSLDQYKHTAPWHYVNIPDGESYESSPKNPDGDIVVAMRRMERTLRSSDATRREKIEALKFLVHFIGDAHQPLHAGRIDDRGGNLTAVRWMGAPEPINLHALWDSTLIEADRLSYTELAAWIDRATEEQMSEWQQAGYVDYVRESMELRDACYELDPKAQAGFRYLNRHLPTVHLRLAQAGVRLAGVLNSIFGTAHEGRSK